ncbi:hypothetical protein [Haloferax sp. YSSS75]|uniref:hypothetical protein n=1 Tax=Haloferax sp. YSSS75 TaxID=3388564 RepID=UPI00398CE80D
MEGNGSSPDEEELIERLRQLPPEERRRVLSEVEDAPLPRPPLVGWASNPLKGKAALRRLVDVGAETREELADFLNSLDELGEVGSMNYGLVGRRSNDLFHVEKGSSKAEDVLSLTPIGKEVAEKFDDDLTKLTRSEIALYRGLHMYGHTVAFLGVLEKLQQTGDHPDGPLKAEIVEELEQYYQNEATAFVGYCGTLCERLELIERTRDGNQMRYRLTVPKEWDSTG